MFRSLDYLSTGNIIYRPGKGVIAADDQFCLIVGRTRAQVFGLTMADLTYPDDLRANEWLLDQALLTDEPFILRKRCITGSGELQWVENRYTVLRLDDGAPIVSMLSRRVTELAKSDEASEQSAQRLAAYIVDIAEGLAKLATSSCLHRTAELLRLTRHSVYDEAAIEP